MGATFLSLSILILKLVLPKDHKAQIQKTEKLYLLKMWKKNSFRKAGWNEC